MPGRVDGTAGGHQRLPGHLATEHALRTDLGALPPELVRAERLQVQQVEQQIHGSLADRHPAGWLPAVAQRLSVNEPNWCTRRVLVEPGVFGGLPATIDHVVAGPRHVDIQQRLSTCRNMSSVWWTNGTR